MSLTISEARDEILTFFKTAWDAGGSSNGLPVIYDDTKQDVPSDASAWARVSVRHTAFNQATLQGETTKRWERTGFVFVQLFTKYGNGLSLSDPLSIICLNAFEGKKTSNGVWFRNVRSNEIGQSGDWHQTNVIAEFIYDEIK